MGIKKAIKKTSICGALVAAGWGAINLVPYLIMKKKLNEDLAYEELDELNTFRGYNTAIFKLIKTLVK